MQQSARHRQPLVERGHQRWPNDWMGVRGKQRFPLLAEERGLQEPSRRPSWPSRPGSGAKRLPEQPVQGCDCPRAQLVKEQSLLCRLCGRPGKPGPHSATRPSKAWLLLMHTYWDGACSGPGSQAACSLGTRTQKRHTPARPCGLLCPRGRPVSFQVSAKRCGPPGPRRRYHRVPSLLGTPCIRNWAL